MEGELRGRARWRADAGVALTIALMSMVLMLGLGVVLVLTTSTETLIAGHFRNAAEARYAAEAGIERAVQDLVAVPDWNMVLSGAIPLTCVDGRPTGLRTLADGTTVDLTQATNLVNCNKVTACSTADMAAFTDDRPWGSNNPRWLPFAYGPLEQILGGSEGAIASRMYVVVWVADDPSENDGDPLLDGASMANPGSGVLSIRAEAFGPGAAHRAVEVTLRRTGAGGGDRGYTGQRGGDERNRGSRKAPVQTPGGPLSRQALTLSTGTLQ